MTENNSLKKLIRARMALLDETYAQAKSNLFAGAPQSLKALFQGHDLIRIQASDLERRSGLVLVTGLAGSGKTTTVASFMNHFDELGGYPHPRIVILENNFELQPLVEIGYNPPLVITFVTENKLRTSGEKAVLLPDLMRSAMSMRADAITVGEIRSSDIIDPISYAASHGTTIMSTLHSKGLHQTFDRLKALSGTKVRFAELLGSLQVIVEQTRIPVGYNSVLLTAVIPITTTLIGLVAGEASEEECEAYLSGIRVETMKTKLERLEKAGVLTRTGGNYKLSK